MFNERLKNLRLISNFSQKELALKINLSPNIICEYEKGRSQPTIETLIKLSGIFNCSIDYLVGNEDDFGFIQTTGEDYTSSEKRIISIYRGLSEREREIFDNLVNSFDDKAETKKSSRA
ncbi:MAG: helix-turn-helix transcriptional regulator [Clostridia bacterium]|nr:helix-turn-helix transcriptional regulator [Clostridia bacterium]